MKRKVKALLATLIVSIVMASVLPIQFTANAAGGHRWSEWIIDVQPTCTENGHMYRVCTADPKKPHTEDKTMPALGHNMLVVSAQRATCTQQGTTTYSCSRCGYTYTTVDSAALGHNYQLTSDKKPNCKSKGIKTYTCSRCGDSYTKEYGKKTTHTYKSKVTKKATCTEKGVKTYTCSICGDSYTKEIKALGHDYVSKVVKKPDCNSRGEIEHTCSRCGDTYKEPYGEKTQHNYVETVKEEKRKIITTHKCTICGNTYVTSVDKPGMDPITKGIIATGSANLVGLIALAALLIPDIRVLIWLKKKKKRQQEETEVA